MIAGYKNTGLFPFDVNAVSFHRLTATNQIKFDDEAFGEQCATPEQYQSALKIMEVILGDQAINVYKEVENLPFFNYGVLPNINAYMVWKQIKLLLSGEISTPSLQIEMFETGSTITPTHSEPEAGIHLPMNEHNSNVSVAQCGIDQLIESIENLISHYQTYQHS